MHYHDLKKYMIGLHFLCIISLSIPSYANDGANILGTGLLGATIGGIAGGGRGAGIGAAVGLGTGLIANATGSGRTYVEQPIVEETTYYSKDSANSPREYERKERHRQDTSTKRRADNRKKRYKKSTNPPPETIEAHKNIFEQEESNVK